VSKRFAVTMKNGPAVFALRRLIQAEGLRSFDCSIPEYNEYLSQTAPKAQNEFVAVTWLLYERESNVLDHSFGVLRAAPGVPPRLVSCPAGRVIAKSRRFAATTKICTEKAP
jgi:hypothetical protein